MDQTPRFIGVLIASVSTVVALIVLPVYILIITYFLKKSHSAEVTVFWIMANIAIVDCAYLIGIVEAGLMTLTESELMPLIISTCTAIHTVYEWLLHFLGLVLALNRLIVILDLQLCYADAVFKVLTFLIWISAIILLFLFHHYGITLEYSYNDNSFLLNMSESTTADELIFDFYFYSDCGAIGASFALYLIIIVAFMLQKFKFRSCVKIESHEIRIFLQGLVTFVPGSTYWILNIIANWKFSHASLALNIVFTIFPRCVPILNFLGYILLNKHVRDSLTAVERKIPCRSASVTRTISLATVVSVL